jgi:hypothetical protein
MFELIVSKIAKVVRDTARTVTAVMRRSPWLAPATIVAFFLIW